MFYWIIFKNSFIKKKKRKLFMSFEWAFPLSPCVCNFHLSWFRRLVRAWEGKFVRCSWSIPYICVWFNHCWLQFMISEKETKKRSHVDSTWFNVGPPISPISISGDAIITVQCSKYILPSFYFLISHNCASFHGCF